MPENSLREGKENRPRSPVAALINFFRHDLWEVNLDLLSRSRRLVFGIARVVYMVVRGFWHDSCPLRASALTYATLLSIVPLLAFAFALAKGFGVSMEPLKDWIIQKAALGNYEIGNQIFNFVNNINAATLGAPALGLLVISVISVMGNIEFSFNHIWGIIVPRTIWRKFSDYLSVIVITPLLVLVGSTLSAYLRANAIVSTLNQYEVFQTFWGQVMSLLPYLMICLGFTFLYMFMPNTRVRFLSALVGGIFAGVVWQVALWGYVFFQVGFAKYAKIYGAMAQVPITLVWVYTSWLIVLFGAEVSFAFQNFRTYQLEGAARRRSWIYREILSLNILEILARRFTAGKTPLAAADLSLRLNVPVRAVEQALELMRQGGLLVRTEGRDGGDVPGRDLGSLTLAAVVDILRTTGGPPSLPPHLRDSVLARDVLERIEAASLAAGEQVTLAELLKTSARP